MFIRKLGDRPVEPGDPFRADDRLLGSRRLDRDAESCGPAGLSFREARELARQWHEKPAGRQFPDSTDLVREDRQR